MGDVKNRLELQCRLRSCLQTILELEPELKRLQVDEFLSREMETLKEFIGRMDGLRIEEADVRRIETATEDFLEELRAPLSVLRPVRPERRGLLQ